MKAVSAIKKELQEISHDRTMLIVLLAFPVFIMLFMGSSFRSMEIVGLPIGITGVENTTFAGALLSELNQSHAFNLRSFGSEAEAVTAFRNGQLRAVIVVPEGFDENIRQGSGSEVRILVDNSDLALEQAMLAAMSAVIEASSANITRSYVYGAWDELRGLNSSAASLQGEIAGTKERMQATKGTLGEVRSKIDNLSISSLEGTLDGATSEVASLQELLARQKGSLAEMSGTSSALFNRSDAFLANATAAIDDSIAAVENTSAMLDAESENLTQSLRTIDSSIAGLEMIRNATTDGATRAALDLNIATLRSLRGNTAQQIADIEAEEDSLAELNATLRSARASLDDYAVAVEGAKSDSSALGDMEAALDGASAALGGLNSSFASAKLQVAALKALLSDIKATSSQIEGTLDAALAQAGSVERLIASLEDTVAEQTRKDPRVIASPLSVKVEDQYARVSFVDFVIPQVVAVSLMLSCFLLSSVSLVREKTRRTIIRALLAPGALANLVAGKIMTLVLLSFVQVALILAVALVLFGVMPPLDWNTLLWGTMISSLVLSSIGVLIGFYARSESAAIQGCLLIAIPMLFLGNIVFSPDLLPAYTQILQQLLPLAHVTSIFKVVLITGGNPAADIAALITYFVLLSVLLAYVVTQRRDIGNYR